MKLATVSGQVDSPPLVLENVGNTEGNAMSHKQEMVPKFAVGSQVRVKKGVVDPNHPGIPLGGWCGVVSQVSGAIRLVRWNEATSSHDGMDGAMWLQETVLEADVNEPVGVQQEEPVGQDRGDATLTNMSK